MSSEDFSSTAFELDLNRNVNFHRCPALNTLPKNGDKTSSERHLNRRPLATSIGAARQLLSTLQRFRINETMHIYTYADLRSQAGHYMSKKSHEDLPLPLSNFSPVRFSAVHGFENKNKYKFSTKPSFPRQISTIPRFNYCNLQKGASPLKSQCFQIQTGNSCGTVVYRCAKGTEKKHCRDPPARTMQSTLRSRPEDDDEMLMQKRTNTTTRGRVRQARRLDFFPPARIQQHDDTVAQ
ncbi:hypothetical protein T02_13458 [Trichinella nativa]|uniref:Uncharacterized protein n=1 Tax=Trichinella nativa TaxID=6335 RepID=A0A0V1LSZ2_9BILA|nr:hypothetical protein T02_13458 [Trichinella nativa]